jgi:hypothetical protein
MWENGLTARQDTQSILRSGLCCGQLKCMQPGERVAMRCHNRPWPMQQSNYCRPRLIVVPGTMRPCSVEARTSNRSTHMAVILRLTNGAFPLQHHHRHYRYYRHHRLCIAPSILLQTVQTLVLSILRYTAVAVLTSTMAACNFCT